LGYFFSDRVLIDLQAHYVVKTQVELYPPVSAYHILTRQAGTTMSGLFFFIVFKKHSLKLDLVAHACDLSYAGDGDGKITV
jgi:hypothetical protein